MIRIWAKIANGYFCLMMSMQQSVIAVVTMYYIAVVPDKVFKMVTRQTLKNAKVNTTCDIENASDVSEKVLKTTNLFLRLLGQPVEMLLKNCQEIE